jgi:hypothetical protein
LPAVAAVTRWLRRCRSPPTPARCRRYAPPR